MMRCRAAILVALFGTVACMPLGRAAAASTGAGRVADPGPTAEHPYQGLRQLTIATVPPVPGVRFSVDGEVFAADASGIATTFVTTAQRAALHADRDAHLAVVEPVSTPTPGVRARFTGWSGNGTYRPAVPVPEEYERATFDLDYRTAFDFVSPRGRAVAPSSIERMQLVNSLGDRVTVRPGRTVWLQGSRTATGRLGLQSRAVSYRIASVTSAGSNVVHRNQQRFFPTAGNPVVELLLFDVRFVASDTLLGRPTGSSLRLEYPNGRVRTVQLSSRGRAVVRQVPRGDYHVTVTGSGPGFTQKLTVSRSQRAALDVITWIDFALGALLLVGIAAVLFIVRWLLRRRGRGPDGIVDVAAAERTEAAQELVGTT